MYLFVPCHLLSVQTWILIFHSQVLLLLQLGNKTLLYHIYNILYNLNKVQQDSYIHIYMFSHLFFLHIHLQAQSDTVKEIDLTVTENKCWIEQVLIYFVIYTMKYIKYMFHLLIRWI